MENGLGEDDCWILSEILEQPVRSGKFNFFENGGNSLLAIQMISEIENKMDIQIRITDLFVYPVFDEFYPISWPKSR